MGITAFTKKLFRSNHRLEALPSYVQIAESFRALLEYERSRVDRNGGAFCLLTLLPQSDGHRVFFNLAENLRQRLRSTDVLGLFGDDMLGVMLPDTSEAGARIVVRDIRAQFTQDDGDLECHIYVYPTSSRRDDEIDGSADSDNSGELETVGDTSHRANDERDVHAMEPLFAKSLPAWKRCLDIVFAGTALLMLSPLLLIVALAIKLGSRGPIIFCQKRVGIGGRVFTILKFRTMSAEAESMKAALRYLSERDGPAFKLKNDPRITWIGRWLRRTCIDELPQFWNVLRGDMSIVGPRPLPCDEQNRCLEWQRQRLCTAPGMTGPWQICSRNVSFSDWMRMDVSYLRSRTLSQDLTIIVRTFLKVIIFRASH